MSLSGALSNAISGLNAASRSAQITASNISNAMTPGYGRREIELGARDLGYHGGVSVLGTMRHMNPGLLSEYRLATAERSGAGEMASYHSRLEALVGTPSQPDSLSARVASFESALIAAASRPDLDARLGAVLHSAEELARGFNEVSDGIQAIRGEADRNIAKTVDDLNTQLKQVREINLQITAATVNGRDTSALEDQRQAIVDRIAEIVPIKEVPRDLGAIALFTEGGAILLDGTAAEIGFTRTNLITPHMTQAAGHLSGLTINGIDIASDSVNGPLRGGKLGALFQIRDEAAPGMQAQLDAAARDLLERFQDPALDASRAAGAAGLFTDNGSAFAAADEIGIAGRLAVNSAVVPEQGGALWRLRDGLGAAASGAVGNGTLLQDMASALSALLVPSSPVGGTSAISAAGLQARLLGLVGTDRNNSDQLQVFAEARHSAVHEQLLEEGVDSDQEMQRLMLIEQAYAANARIIQTVDDMLDALMRI